MRVFAVALIAGFFCAACATGPLVREEVRPGILAGRYPHGDVDYELLRSRGVKTILDIEVLPWNIARGRRQAKRYGFVFRDAIVLASPWEPSEHQVEKALLALHDPTLRPIFMHCHFGRDRASMILGLYRIYYEGWTPEAAWKEMLRSGFRVRWTLRGLRKYFWSHTQIPDWAKSTSQSGELEQRSLASDQSMERQSVAKPVRFAQCTVAGITLP